MSKTGGLMEKNVGGLGAWKDGTVLGTLGGLGELKRKKYHYRPY